MSSKLYSKGRFQEAKLREKGRVARSKGKEYLIWGEKILRSDSDVDFPLSSAGYFVATSTLNHANPFTGLTSTFLNPAFLHSFAH